MGSKTDPFRGPIRTMATLKCLACGHDNNVGDESCSSCSSSLNLKLCSACEAINANEADRCHSCNADFRMEPEVVTSELDTPSLRQPAAEAVAAEKALPAVWRLATDQARRPSTRFAVALAVLSLLVIGAAYYFYASPQAPTQPPAVPKAEAAQKAEPQRQPDVAPPGESAPAPTVSAKIVPPRAAATLSRSAPPPEPKRTTAAVTHTRAASATAPSSTTPVDASMKTTAGVLPVITTPAVAAPAPAADAAIIPVSGSPAMLAESRRMSVTHTKADFKEPAITTTPPAAAVQPTDPAEARNDEPAGCAPAVVALGLCKSK